jgi:hypothetical protein
MKIVNPTFGISTQLRPEAVAGYVNWREDPIALFSNGKPNARQLLEGIRDRLADVRRVDNVGLFEKQSAAEAAPAHMMDQVVNNYRIALLALCD